MPNHAHPHPHPAAEGGADKIPHISTENLGFIGLVSSNCTTLGAARAVVREVTELRRDLFNPVSHSLPGLTCYFVARAG